AAATEFQLTIPVTSSTMISPASLRSDRDRHRVESVPGIRSESLTAFIGISNWTVLWRKMERLAIGIQRVRLHFRENDLRKIFPPANLAIYCRGDCDDALARIIHVIVVPGPN